MDERLIEVEEGQYYKDNKRGRIYNVDYRNDDIVLLYDGGSYRIERLDHFTDEIASEHFEELPNYEVSESEESIPLREISGVGEQTYESLINAGLTTPEDFDYLTDERIIELDSVGESTLENIYDWIDNNVTGTVEI